MSTLVTASGCERASTVATSLRATVVVPTYLRPSWLIGCMQSLTRQTRLPDEVIAVMRPEDFATHDAFDNFVISQGKCGIAFRGATVTEPGFLLPIIAGIEAATGDVVAFIDDDAEALPDWLERLLAPYSDPAVAGAGGRVVNIENGAEVRFAVANDVGKFRSCRAFVGNMYRDLPTNDLREVDFFMGGNMSYRREALRRVIFDRALAQDVAFHYEVDLGMQVKTHGARLIYDPLARVRHYSAPRAQAGMRQPGRETIFWYNHNSLYVAMKHSAGLRRWLAVAYSYTVGSSRSWGVVSALVHVARRRTLQSLKELAPAFRGKALAIRACLTQCATKHQGKAGW